MRSAIKVSAALPVVALAGVLALAGCSTSGDSAGSADMGTDMSYPESAPADMAIDSGQMDSGQMDSGQRNSGQQFIRTGSVSMTSNNTIETVAGITALVEQFNGSISQEEIRTIEENDYANMTVRVPDSDLEEFVVEVRTLGETTAFSISEIDVTLTITDLDARINSLNATINKLIELQEQAATVTDLVAVEAELATRTAERDSLVAQRAVVQDQVAESTVYIDISPDLGKSTSSPDFIGGIESGWQALINLAAGAVTLIGFLIPIVIALVIVIGLLVIVTRLIKRARQRT
jgi:hypothetical protein